MSARAPSWIELRDEECNEEDLEDLEPVRSGGDPGTVCAKVVISSLELRPVNAVEVKVVSRLCRMYWPTPGSVISR